MSKFTRFIKDIVLPDKVDKERRKKILSECIIETWTRDEQERKAKEAREIAKKTYKRIRSSKADGSKYSGKRLWSIYLYRLVMSRTCCLYLMKNGK